MFNVVEEPLEDEYISMVKLTHGISFRTKMYLL